ncbi:MAG: DoxX family membrane protein [Opitutus sp.]
MKHLPTIARILLGLLFFIFGLNGFLNFIPPPPTGIPEGAMAFGAAMMKTGYLLQLLKGTEVLAGVLLLCNRFVPLALAVLAPVIINIVAFHAFLAPSGLPVPLVIGLLEVYLAWCYRHLYRPMLAMRATPVARASAAV